MRRLSLLLLFTAPLFAQYTCPTGFTQVNATSSGNISSASTWGGTNIGTGDGKCLVSGSYTPIVNQDLGTAGSTGVVLVGSFGTTGTLPAVHTCFGSVTGSICINFASTGADPCGSGGGVTNPSASATMQGIFANSGNVTLVGTQSNPIVFNSANNSSPIYISQTTNIVTGVTPGITVEWGDLYHLGSGALCGQSYPYFAGITYYGYGPATITLEHNRFNAPYQALAVVDGNNPSYDSVITENNLITGRTGPNTFSNPGGGIGTLTTGGNVEYNPGAGGSLHGWSSITTSYTDLGGDSVGGSSTYYIAGKSALGGAPGCPSGGVIVSGFLGYNVPSWAGNTSNQGISLTCNSAAVASSYFENFNQSVRFSNNGTVSNSVGISNHLAYYGQAGIALSTGHLTVFGNLCVFNDATLGTNPACIFVYDTGGTSNTSGVVAYNNTLVALVPSPSCANTGYLGIGLGDGLGPTSGNYIHHNLITGFCLGITDSSTFAAASYLTSCSSGVGVCNNATFANTVAYGYNVLPTNWQSGATVHPNAAYGDVGNSAGTNLDPSYLDPNRAVTPLIRYDILLGGPGTALDFFQNLGAYQTGWGTTTYNFLQFGTTPTASLIAWTRQGYAPGNAAICPGGVTIGAVPCATAGTAMVP